MFQAHQRQLQGFAGVFLGLWCSLATAGSLLPAPEDLVNTPTDFRFRQVLQMDRAGIAPLDEVIIQSGLHWDDAPDAALNAGKVPNVLLELSPQVEHIILADLAERRVYLLENGGELRVLRHMYASIGKNGTRKLLQDDGRTPIGVYTITRYIADDALPELYGSGAFPVDYPNSWDQRAGRTGYGIWVHGVPRQNFSRPPRSSEGCVAIGNDDLDSLKPFVTPQQTRVVFTDRLAWLDPGEQRQRRQSFLTRLEAWRAAWNQGDTDRYLDFYAADFKHADMDRAQFAQHKRRVNQHKTFIDVELSDLNVFDYPDEAELRLVEFTQDYRSNNYSSVDRKHQFWRHDQDGQWRIVQESEINPG